MKKYIFLTLALSILFTVKSLAQRSDLKGPAAKNDKVWKSTDQGASLIIVSQHKPLKGPKAKNRKPWETNQKMTHAVITADRKDLKGPKTKNRKPENGQKEKEIIIQTSVPFNIWPN